MKKILTSLVLSIVLVAFFAPGVASAQMTPGECVMDRKVVISDELTCADNQPYDPDNSVDGICCLFNAIYNIADWIFIILVLISVVLAGWGGIDIAMSGGDSEKVKNGRNRILYAAIGLLVAFVTRGIPSIVMMVLGV